MIPRLSAILRTHARVRTCSHSSGRGGPRGLGLGLVPARPRAPGGVLPRDRHARLPRAGRQLGRHEQAAGPRHHPQPRASLRLRRAGRWPAGRGCRRSCATRRSYYLRSGHEDDNLLRAVGACARRARLTRIYFYGGGYMYALAAWTAVGAALTRRAWCAVSSGTWRTPRMAWLYRLGRAFSAFAYLAVAWLLLDRRALLLARGRPGGGGALGNVAGLVQAHYKPSHGAFFLSRPTASRRRRSKAAALGVLAGAAAGLARARSTTWARRRSSALAALFRWRAGSRGAPRRRGGQGRRGLRRAFLSAASSPSSRRRDAGGGCLRGPERPEPLGLALAGLPAAGQAGKICSGLRPLGRLARALRPAAGAGAGGFAALYPTLF